MAELSAEGVATVVATVVAPRAGGRELVVTHVATQAAAAALERAEELKSAAGGGVSCASRANTEAARLATVHTLKVLYIV